ncbi:MAG: TonB-dependent receptor [Pseudomonadota bacterium]
MNKSFARVSRRSLMLGSGLAGLMLGAAQASAQDLVVAPAPDLETQANREASADSPVIIVTGQKIVRSLQDTQASVAVVDQEAIQDANFRDVYDVIGQTANVVSLFDGAGFSIRGLRNTGAGSGEATSDVASIFVDGVFIPSSLLTNGAFSLWDAQSVEIFRGPQSTIQGRNSLAGAIVVRTVDPGDTFSGDFQLEAAEFDSYRASAAVTLPIAPGQVSLRLAGDYLTKDGFQEGTFVGRDDVDESEAITARATLLLTPEFAPDFSARLNFTYSDNEEGENRVVEDIFVNTGRRENNQNNIDRQGAEAYIASAELSYDFSENFSVTAVTGYIESNSFFNFDPDSNNPLTTSLPLPGGIEDEFQMSMSEDRIFTQELRFTYEDDNISALLGGYFYDNAGSFDSDNNTVVGTDFAFPDPETLAFVLGITEPEATALRGTVVSLVPAFPVNLINMTTTDVRNYAVFGEATFDLTERLSVTLGARYDREDVNQTAVNGTLVPQIPETGIPSIDLLLLQVTQQFSNVFNFDADNTFDAFLPKAGIAYDITDDVTVGFTYQRAYRAGALSFNTFRASLAPAGSTQEDLEALGIVNQFEPEFTNNYEFSFRSQWMDGDLVVNANAYYIDYTDQQILIQLSGNPLDTITDNAGASRLKGFEIETTMRPTDGLSFFANVGVTDTEYTDGAGVAGGDITGFEFTYAPQVTVGLGGRYEHDSGFYANLRTRFTDGSFTSFVDFNETTNEAREAANADAIANGLPAPFTDFLPTRQDPSGFNDSPFTVDLALGWEGENISVELFANNLFNEEYLTFDVINDPTFPIGANGLPDRTQAPNGFVPNRDTTSIAGAPQVFGIRIQGGF